MAKHSGFGSYLWLKVALVFSLVGGGAVGAGETTRLDLAQPIKQKTVDPGAYTLELKNALPTEEGKVARYWIDNLIIVSVPIARIPSPRSLREFSIEQPSRDPCPEAIENLDRGLLATKSEGELGTVLKKALAAAPTCRDDLDVRYRQVTSLRLDEAIPLDRGEKADVKICREATDGSSKNKCWNLTLTTGPVGEWELTYGLTFVPQRDERYFLDEMKETSTSVDDAGNTTTTENTFFLIEKERDPDDLDLDFVPSLMYSFTPASRANRSWRNSFVAGLGYDLDSPTLFAGWGRTHYRNVMLTAGLVIHKQTRLDGRYELGERLEQTIGEDMLVDSRYRPSFYFGVAFRFDSAPFAKKKGAQDGDEEDEKDEGDGEDEDDGGDRKGPEPEKPTAPGTATSAEPAAGACVDIRRNAAARKRISDVAEAGELVTLVRHAEDCSIEDAGCRGQTAVPPECFQPERPLTDHGRLQAISIRATLEELGALAKPVSSPACRAIQTASFLSDAGSAAHELGLFLELCNQGKSGLEAKIEAALAAAGNEVFVTHSQCIQGLEFFEGTIRTTEDLGIMVFLARSGEGESTEVLGCALP